ncbi:hypothetical protein [Paramagnetospirillum caucaseum]|uniref:hypothetical protein n=1 Tax=Paramagnetospirillum caucaseum TaxID=1244869 RepID=UPI00126971B7|nr:hypothetical protein [Paramagnetospirillum caucaseum]
MDRANIALRAQDFHEGLRSLRAYGPKEAYLRNTLLIGKTATLASHIKGIDYIENSEALYGLAAELGINGTELEVVLRTLEEADFARIVGSASNFTRIELRVPELRNSYEELGEQWLRRNPGELEVAAVSVLDQVVSVPKEKSAFQRDFGLDAEKLKLLVELGANGGLIDEFSSDDGEVFLYSPLTMEESPQAVVEVCKRFGQTDIATTLNAIRGQQGVPLSLVKDKSAEIASVGVRSGLFCPVEIEMNGHDYTFLFTPRGNLTREERGRRHLEGDCPPTDGFPADQPICGLVGA